ncbi:MAG: hypothetical protein LBU74_01860 [Methanobacteriaceae archaeon]|jgi:hypothetical protein|nr:hypothetical protein [Candidatus Methanorudis spinitermitis]
MEKTKYKYVFIGLILLLVLVTSLNGIFAANGNNNTDLTGSDGNLTGNITDPFQNIFPPLPNIDNGSSNNTTSKPSKVSQSSVITAAKLVNNYISKNKILPDSVLVSGYRFSMPEFLYLMSKTISNKKINSKSQIKIKYDIKNPNNATGTGSKGKIYSVYYSQYANTIIKSIDKTNKSPNYITTAGGNKLQYQSIIYLFAKVLSSTKNNLPYYVPVNIKKSTSFNLYMPVYNRNAKFTTKTLGQDEKGNVQLIGAIGDSSSKIKIAYIIGIHPLENNAHQSLDYNLKTKVKNLKYKYYIYKINVTQGIFDYDLGRRNGELLAQKYVLPHIKKNKYNLVIDIHANQGTKGGNYKKTNFIFAPLNQKASKTIAKKLIKNIPGLSYYFPESQTSPHYITNPLVNEGINTIIYETYVYETKTITDKYMKQLIANVDVLKL